MKKILLITLLILLNLPFISAQTGNTQATAIDLGSYNKEFMYMDTQNTVSYSNNYTGRPTNDVFYKFTLTKAMDVIIAHCGSELEDTYLHLLNASGTRIAYNDDYSGNSNCSSYHSYLKMTNLAPGTYYIVSEGYSQNGNITTYIQGSVYKTEYDLGTKNGSFTYTHTQNTANSPNSYTGRPTNDVFYKLTTTVVMDLVISHCGSAVSDTYVHLLNAVFDNITSNDDYSGEGHCASTLHSYLKVTNLAPGTYYIVSEGYSQNGNITTQISATAVDIQGDSFQNPIVAGTYNSSFQYSDTKNTGNFSNRHTARTPNDVFYRFTLGRKMLVTMTHCGSALGDTYMTLLDASGNQITSNDDYSGDGACPSSLKSFIQRTLDAGTYYVVSEGYALGGFITTNITGYASEDFGYPDIPDAYSSDPDAVGAVGGSLNVSPTGGAVYSIPIDVPQGVSGLQPNLAITYNSQAGNGLAGWGCNLSGLSAITRAPRDIYHDGTAKGITHLGHEAYLLDGQRLVYSSGTEGQEGAVYYPESDPLTKVIVHGTYRASTANSWFEVQSSDGMKYYYGSTDNGRQNYTAGSLPRIHAWYLDYAEDPLGNRITYRYYHSGNFVYPDMISYGDNKNESGTLGNTILFEYEYRNDITPFVIEGVKGQMSWRLKAITSRTAGSTYRRYELQYDDTGDNSVVKYSRLESITQKNAAGEALKPLRLNWLHLPSFSQSVIQTTVGSPGCEPAANQKFIAADLNGDGLCDLVGFKDIPVGSATSSYAYLYQTSKDANGNVQISGGTGANALGSSFKMGDWTELKGPATALDFNGDGINDLLVPNVSIIKELNYKNAEFRFIGGYINNQQIFYPLKAGEKMPLYATGDINNDGKCNLIVVEVDKSGGFYSGAFFRHNGGTSFSDRIDFNLNLPAKPEKLFVSDFNGDGMQDLIVFYNGGYTLFRNQGNGLTLSTFSDSNKTVGNSIGAGRWTMIRSGDFNGDGLTDFLINDTGSNSWYFGMNNGDGTFTKTLACTLEVFDQDFTSKDDDKFDCHVYDFDGDGKSDAVIVKAMYTKNSDLGGTWGDFSKTRAFWMRSTGSALTQITLATSNRDSDALAGRYVLGDFNGDGQPELMNYGYNCYSSTSANVDPVWRMYRNPNLSIASGKVTRVTDSYGAVTSINYASLVGDGIYTKGTRSTYPVADYAVPLHAVKTVTKDNGAAGSITTNYRYNELKAHLQGKGILGMTSQTTSSTLGIETETGVKAWNTTFYVPSQTYTKVTMDGKTAETNRTITVADKGTKKYFAYPSTKTEKDLDGNTVTTTYQFNTTYGYMTEEKADFGGNMYKTVQYGNYILAGGSYKPQLVTAIQKHADDASTFTKKTAITYNTAKGYRTQVIENQGSSLPLTTDYTYDTFGNVLTSKATGSGITPVTSYYNYDPTKRFVVKTYTSPASEVNTFTYDRWGNVLTEKDETNASDILTTTHTYDNWGNRIMTVYPDGQKATVKRGWNNNSSKRYFVLTQGTGQPWVKTWYDNKGREVLVESIGEKGMTVRQATSYNTKGQLSQKQVQTGGLMITKGYAYDARGRLTGQSSSTGQSSTYSYGNRTQTTVTNGRTYTKTYDAWGGIKTSVDPATTVTYTYKSLGKPQSVTTGGATFTMTYDNAGNQTGLTDPNAGTSSYTYDAAGRLTRQVDGRGKVTANTYDALGRLATTTIDGIATSYTYGTSGNDLLRLIKVQTGSNYAAYTYDRYGRTLTEKQQVEGTGLLEFGYSYNTQGQLSSVTYPGSLQMNRQYDAYGNLSKVLAGTQTLWERTGETGTVTTAQLGGTLTATRTRNAQGLLTNMKTVKGSTVLHNMDYVFNGATGNLTSRTGMLPQAESFTYDNMDRLTTVKLGSATTMSVGYAANGNITSKTGLGNYTYQTVKPHAIRYVDNTGGLVSNKLQTVAYNGFNKAYALTDSIGNDAYRLDITYGPDMQRWKTVQIKNNSLQKTIIFAGDYESVTEGSTTKQLYYVSGGDGLAAVYVKQAGQPDKVYYVCTDHLGSIIKLIDSNGTEVFKASYDAWGRQTVANNSFAFHRGYTGHEHLAEFGLINMNGRMYDPVLGRFLSPDPYVQSPLFSQNFNRYAYCWNNPLRFNDPDGEWIHIAIGALVGGVINWGAHGFRMDMEGLKAFGIGAAAGAVGAATFGVGLGAMGVAGAGLTSLGAVGGGGFLAGLGAGAFSYMASTPILSIGNNIAFNDPIPTPDEYIAGLGFAALGGGLTQGLAAHMQGNNFLDGSLKESALINNAQVAAINEGLKAPMAAAEDMDAALMERVGNKTVDNFLNSRIAGQTTDAIVPYYPSNNGATSAGWKYDYLNVGDIVDRFGSEYGTFVSRPGTPIPMRALPPNNSGAYNTYEILKPIPVMKSTIAPAFGQPGGGIQYKLPFTIKELKGIGYIK